MGRAPPGTSTLSTQYGLLVAARGELTCESIRTAAVGLHVEHVPVDAPSPPHARVVAQAIAARGVPGRTPNLRRRRESVAPSPPMRVSLLLLLVLAGLGCAYPRRSTSLCPATSGARPAPPDVWRLAFSTAVIPPRQRGDQPWDEDGSPPDVFVRVYRGEELVFESTPVEGLQPDLGVTTPNLHLPSSQSSRIELWDADSVLPTVIGVWRGSGMPSGSMEDGDTRIMLDGRSTVGFRVLPPTASRGAGIPTYEVRRSSLRIIEVLEHSPAGRAGLVPGDEIVAIGGEPVAELGEARAAGALSRACSEATRLSVERADGRVEDLVLDRGYVWVAR